MSLPSEYEKQRDAAAENYPRVYEIKYMNADTPRLSGSEYLQHGFKAGADWSQARAEKRIQELEEKVDIGEIAWNKKIYSHRKAEEKIQSLEQKLISQRELNEKLAEGNSVLYKQKAELEKQVQGLVDALESIVKFKFRSPGPGGCDSHGIEHPCGPCFDLPNEKWVARQALKEWQAAREKE